MYLALHVAMCEIFLTVAQLERSLLLEDICAWPLSIAGTRTYLLPASLPLLAPFLPSKPDNAAVLDRMRKRLMDLCSWLLMQRYLLLGFPELNDFAADFSRPRWRLAHLN